MLRRWLGITVVAVGWAGLGVAQAQSPVATNWSGFYIGGSVGGADSISQTKTTVASSGDYFTTPDPAQIAAAGDSDLSQWRPSAGLHGGYGQQFGNLLVGIEASANSLFFNDERSVTVGYLSSPGNQFTLKQSVTADWMVTLRPRLGWAQNNWLAYVTGGLAVTRLQMDNTFTDTSFSAFSNSTTTETRLGWTLGGGAEYALSQNWSLRGEYLYADFGRMDSSSRVSETFGGAPAFLNHSADLQTHAVLIGLTYRFTGF